MIILVYVINLDGKPLMPCIPVIARLLLTQHKAKCVKRCPFTIKLLYQSTSYTQPLTLGVDTGSGTMGSAVVDTKNQVIYMSQTEVRNNIAREMKQRSKYRRARRFLKTRYRKARWLNRKNSTKKGRFSPTMVSKFHAHVKEISFVKSILPITKLILETATFDPHALKNPAVLQNKLLYQKGPNYGFGNTKAFVLNRDKHTCQHCKGKTKDKRLQVHHIIFRCQGGSDDEKNLVTLCATCHKKLHDGLLVLKKPGKKKGQLSHATQMNSIRLQLLKFYHEAIETFGFITKENRQMLGLPKEHYFDAVVIASQGEKVTFKTDTVLLKKCVAEGDYQQTKGIRSEQPVQTRKIAGFRKFDKVRFLGKEYFIKGRMSTGYAILMDVEGKKAALKPIPKFKDMIRLSARKSWLLANSAPSFAFA
nr:RNA-guided endonuclease IscB [Pectinatus frisingensis]